ncbi:uncharacterized protein STEHIDRAFT_137143 [Stereum hirsutum FP-91666 SS1]|uniref:uncharacterized protein n=1 Tax=Stereum hirsutum (strain FP-91666) TaxID=721885 RepID=UPI000440E896|nr:uncharacterized protein STEHIDRAFT_137143 [Stereum hirsutum FP-91666 SS1]EIM91444.1 hypothetical protein STEHIDRAFT_137143 [Stereum hirsutum FP-91666 SS1]
MISHNPLQDPNGVNVDHTAHVDPTAQSLNQALDPHLSQQHYHYPPPAHIITQTNSTHPTDHLAFYSPHQPPPPQPQQQQSQQDLQPTPPLERQQEPVHVAPPKRKYTDATYGQSSGVGGSKKRRHALGSGDAGADGGDDDDEVDGVEGEGGGNTAARHWSDDEKTKLFVWLLGQEMDEHFDALKTKKNTCFRECAMDAFGGRKTFLAVKGCYERNFVVFKQIYAFETFTANMHHQNPTQSEGGTSVDQEASNQRLRSENETERLREYERKIYAARKAGFHVGNLSSRILDHWHRMGWYALFYHRFHGDPNIHRPAQGSGGNRRTMGPPAPPMHSLTPTSEESVDPLSGPSHHHPHHPQNHAHHQSLPRDRDYGTLQDHLPPFDAGDSIPSPPTTPSGMAPLNSGQMYETSSGSTASSGGMTATVQPPHNPYRLSAISVQGVPAPQSQPQGVNGSRSPVVTNGNGGVGAGGMGGTTGIGMGFEPAMFPLRPAALQAQQNELQQQQQQQQSQPGVGQGQGQLQQAQFQQSSASMQQASHLNTGQTSQPQNQQQPIAAFTSVAQTLLTTCMRLLQAQQEDSKVRLEYLRRREEREETESRIRMEMERRREEREEREHEAKMRGERVRQKSEIATEILSNGAVEGSVRSAAGEYLKKLFAE